MLLLRILNSILSSISSISVTYRILSLITSAQNVKESAALELAWSAIVDSTPVIISNHKKEDLSKSTAQSIQRWWMDGWNMDEKCAFVYW